MIGTIPPIPNMAHDVDQKEDDLDVIELLKSLSEQYTIHGLLERGAGSIVYQATDNASSQKVALKIIPKQRLSIKMTQSQSVIQKEILMMASLYHPNIVRLLNHHNTQNHIVIVTEFVSGGELFHELVKQGSFSEPLTRRIMIQVAEGLKYLHLERGIVHRDLKLENLLFQPLDDSLQEASHVSRIGNIKIADFGLAKVVHDTNTQTPCGTFEYSAPEIFHHQHYSKSVDMWALGCVLYTMLCGFPPFYGENPGVIAAKVRQGEFSFPSPWWDGISTEAKDLVCKLLDIDPTRRLDIKALFQHPWIKGETLPTGPARFLNRSRSRNSRPSLSLQINRNPIQTPHLSNMISTSLKSPSPLNGAVAEVKDFVPSFQRIQLQEKGWCNTKFLSKPIQDQTENTWPDLSEQVLVSPVDAQPSPISSTPTTFGVFFPSVRPSPNGALSTPSASSPSFALSPVSLRRRPNVPATIIEGEMAGSIDSMVFEPPPPPTNTPTSSFNSNQMFDAALALASLECAGDKLHDSSSNTLDSARPAALTKESINAVNEAYHDLFTMDDMTDDHPMHDTMPLAPGSLQDMEGIEDSGVSLSPPTPLSNPLSEASQVHPGLFTKHQRALANVPLLKSTDETQSSLLVRRRNRHKSGMAALSGVPAAGQENVQVNLAQ